ncbi:MAG: DUF6779 domain-containing protein [Pseudonocardiaceae bacterium]
MPQPDEPPLPCGRGRALMLGTVMLAAAAAAVLAVGAQDARLLRLGLVAALWAALLAAFAAARMRREISSGAHRVDELRTVYQLELEREVAARHEHTLTVERELREQTAQAERSEIAALRTELAAVRMNLERLAGGQSLAERATVRVEPAGLLPVATYSHKLDDSLTATAALGVPAQAPRSITAAGSPVRVSRVVPGSQPPPSQSGEQYRVDRALMDSAPAPREDTELRFGPGPGCQPAWEPELVRNGKHDTSNQELSGSSNNGSHANGHHNNGSDTQRAAQEESVVGPQRSVRDLLAAHGGGSLPRRRHSREDGSRA